ncbi:MAG TPA: CoA transferase [Burkholderiaceae bacterium]|nr:CoA transferase [Burkholderiaceae bacterium]
MAAELPLAPYRVLDLTRVRAGPTAVRQLADWGADVIRIEEPVRAGHAPEAQQQRLTPDFQNLQRNKRSLTLDLKSPRGREVLSRLVQRADVLVENYRPDVKHRLGIDHATLAAINPRLVYASISGFGQDGPYARRPGFDQIVQGLAGLMSITGLPGQGPVRAGIAVADSSAGLYAAFGIVMALLERERTGVGQWVQTSLLEALLALMDFQSARWLVAHEVPEQAGNDHPTTIPTGVFDTADGQVNICVVGPVMWERFCHTLDRPEWLHDPRFSSNRSRSTHRAELNAAIGAIVATQPSTHWIERLNVQGVACGPINRVDQAFADPQVQHLGLAWPTVHPRLGAIALVGQPLRSDRHRATLRAAAPTAGEHADAILADAGYSAEDIERLRNDHVI